MANEQGRPFNLSPHVIYPLKRDQTVRISEQEARVLCCGLLNNLSLYYSIETPTKQRYVQKGKKKEGMSAQIDLTMFRFNDKSFIRICNIEFKAHNCGKGEIAKDIEKLVREKINGNWFHILKNTNRGTMTRLFKKFNDSFLHYSQSFTHHKISIIFCFCILERQRAYIKHFIYDPSKQEYESFVSNFFNSLKLDTDWHIFSKSFSKGDINLRSTNNQTKDKDTPVRSHKVQKAWYYWQADNDENYILAFVNSMGSCSLRRFKAENGEQLERLPNKKGNYQDKFAEYLRTAQPLCLSHQPNLVRDCKERLQEWVMAELREQISNDSIS